MQVPNPLLNLTVQLGDEGKDHQQMLAEVDIANYSGAENVQKMKEKAKFTEDINEDVVCVLKYYVQPGREAEAEKYFQLGLDGEMEKELMSPLQFITRTPDNVEMGKVSLKSLPGEIQIIYRFLADQIDEELKQILLSNISKFHTFNINVLLKGYVSHSLKNRANVKVDYSRFQLTADQIESQTIIEILAGNEMIPGEVLMNPFFNTLGKIRKFNLNLRYKGFREINKYYDGILQKMGNNSLKKQERQDFKYINHGLFREKVQGYLFYSDQFVLTGNISHHGQDVFMRLIKVYFKAAKKGLDL